MPKSAPPKHKDKNKYRFKTFSERLALVNIDAVHRIKRVQTDEDGSEDFSQFAECLEKWRDLDLSIHFANFKRQIAGKAKNYKLVLHFCDDLNSALQQHLVVEDSLAIPALLELTVALCVDMSSDFYPHFPKYFKILTGLLHTQEVEKLEAVFSAITLLFRHLWRCMLTDMGPVLDMYAVLVTSEQPAHIGAFAAESISYLLRKTRDREFVVEKLLMMSQSNVAASDAIARVLFNLVKSAQHHFHICVSDYLPVILSFLKSDTSSDLTFRTINSSIQLMADYTTKEHGEPVWKLLLSEMKTNDESYAVHLTKLLNTWCKAKNGARICSYKDLHCYFKKTQTTQSGRNSDFLLSICELLCTVLCGSKSGLTSTEKQNFLQVFEASTLPCDGCVSMWKTVCNAEDFHSFGKRAFLKFCQTRIQTDKDKFKVLDLLSEFVVKQQQLPSTEQDLETFVPLHLDFSIVSREKSEKSPGDIIAELIKNESSPEILWQAILVLQHIQPLKLIEILKFRFPNLLAKCQNEQSLAVVAIATQALYTNKQLSVVAEHCQLFVQLLEQWPSSRHALFVAGMLLRLKPSFKDYLTEDMRRSLVENVSSFSSPVRLMSLQILHQLDPSPQLEFCIQAEMITASIQDIRDKLLHLSKLLEHRETSMNQKTKEIVVRFLLANFSVNFSALWPGLQGIICSQATSDRNDVFWSIFFETLTKASDDAEISQWWKVGLEADAEINSDNVFSEYVQGNWKNKAAIVNTRIDCFNFRLQLWKTLAMLPHFSVAESNNRVLVTLLFRFLEEEYYQVDKNHSPMQSLQQHDAENEPAEKVHRRKDGVKMLEAILTVFAKFTNMRSAVRSDELHELFEEFLMHSDSEIQNVALQCVFSSKGKGMHKYKEQLLEFANAKKFRDSLINLNLDDIKSEERHFVIPVLLRFLFGRLKSKTGSSTGMKSAPVAGRLVIIRFLCNLENAEVGTFVDLVIAPFTKSVDFTLEISDAVQEAHHRAVESMECVPLSRQQGVLSTIRMIIEKMKHKLSAEYFSSLLKLLLCVAASHNAFLAQKDTSDNYLFDKRFLLQIKQQKKSTIECIINLLDSWPSANLLSSSEVNAIFQVLVVSELSRQVNESSGSPTMLLKLFNLFSNHLKYRPLLIKACTNSTSPMDTIVQILSSGKTSSEVSSYILDILINLLTDPRDVEQVETTPTILNGTSSAGELCMELDVNENHSVREVGLSVLKPYLNQIMSYFVQKLSRNKNRKDVSLQPKYLDFLSEISEVASDRKLLSSLTRVLLSHVIAVAAKHRGNQGKSLVPALRVLSSVIHESSFAPKLGKLFSKVDDRESRLLLVKVFCRACQEDERQKWTCDVIKRLNAWDKRFIEELDFDSRLTAFQDIAARLKEENFVELFQDHCLQLMPVLHSCTHTLLHYYADISLRESVSRVLELLVDKVKQLFTEENESAKSVYQTVVRDMLLPTIQAGLRSLDEGCRHEAISLLSKIVRTFPDEPLVRNMTHLSNWNDPEDDFYENIRHIQLHRRARAFRRIAKCVGLQQDNINSMEAAENSEAKPDTLIPYSVAFRFLLPIAVQSLYSTDFSKHVHLKDACLDAVKSCCSTMPWSMYKRFLLQSVWSIDKHKLGLDVVCGALEVFPFDLSNYSVQKTGENKTDKLVLDFNVIPLTEDDADQEEVEMEISEDKVDSPNQEDQIPSQASAILDDVTTKVIPKLQQILNRKDSDEDQHKLTNAKADIDKCKKKIPLALAIVSALRKLPGSVVKSQLPGVILKMVGFLRHRLHEVRVLASATMVKIVNLLDLSNLSLILKELKAGLARGYQKHVLTSVIYAIVVSLGTRVNVGELDFCLQPLLQVLNEDLFGATAAEKKVEQLKSKIPEARGRSKAYPSYKILATVVGKTSVMGLIEPLKVHLEETRNHSVKKIAKDVFVEISLGLLENKLLTAQDFLTLTYGILCEKIPGLFPSESKNNKKKGNTHGEAPLQPLSLILTPEPARYGTKAPAKSVKTNMHLLVEFALQLLHSAIKKQSVSLIEQSHLEMLDQFVEKLMKCLKSTHQQTVVDGIRCLTRLFRTDLPSLQEHCKQITASLFQILRDQTKGASNQEMAAVSFKSLSVLCSTQHGSAMTESQLKILLTYAEEDLYSVQRQSHAFELLKSILKRGLQCPEVLEVIDKVRKIAIQSHTASSRAQARSLYLHFVVNYPMSAKKLDSHIEFILAQLTYEFEEGRNSSLEMLSSVVTTFPIQIVSSHAGVIFVPTAAVLINDDSAKCRKMAAGVLKFLLERLEVDARNQLFALVIHWYESDDIKQRRLAAMVVSIFTEVSESGFRNQLPTILHLILKNLEIEQSELDSEDVSQKSHDHSLFFHLSAFLSIIRNCDVINSNELFEQLDPIFERVTKLLAYSHDWVRLVCCQILGCYFSNFTPESFSTSRGETIPFFGQDLETMLGELCQHFYMQLKADILADQLAEQVVKNLLFVLRVLDSIHEQPAEGVVHPTLLKLMKQLLFITKFEQSDRPKETMKRTAVLKLCAALCLNLPNPDRVLKLLLEPVYRGMNASATHSNNEIESVTTLRHLAAQVLDVIKSKIDSETFSKTYLAVTRKITHKRRERKREKAVQLVADPRKAAAFKLRKQERTKNQRKRKIANMRPEYGIANKIKKS
uniref:Small subunit processome component 20 homolog n=1 Tax=Phallusia mammillata TaxID=59560 RepID=A0A6F9DVU2_9ASCI|nr:small subunit processome component 20 homolog [Phallusia mammillata]